MLIGHHYISNDKTHMRCLRYLHEVPTSLVKVDGSLIVLWTLESLKKIHASLQILSYCKTTYCKKYVGEQNVHFFNYDKVLKL